MNTPNKSTRIASFLRSLGGVLLAGYVVFPFLMGGIRSTSALPILGYTIRYKSFPQFVYVSPDDIRVQQEILFLALFVLIVDLIYELVILPRMRRSQ